MDDEMVSAEEARVVLQVAERTGQGAEILARLARTVVALHAIVDGRTEPPTVAELAAHDRAGGRWIVLRAGRVERPVDGYDARLTTPYPSRWWPLARDGRPCAWPVVSR